MALYSEPGSGVGNSSAALIDAASHADSLEQIRAVRRKARRRRAPAASHEATDEIPLGTCRRCGCIAEHATSEDCIDYLRDLIADLTCAELQGRVKRQRKK